MKQLSRNQKRLHRKGRSRTKVFGTAKRPRVSIFRSLRAFYAQLIDDQAGQTLASIDTRDLKAKALDQEAVRKAGQELAKRAAEKKIKEVVFDRSGYQYHGKVKAFAEGAREGGLKF